MKKSAKLLPRSQLYFGYLLAICLYPKTEKNIAKQIQKDYTELKRLQSYPKKTCKKYLSDIVSFNKNMSKGYDIHSKDKAYEK